MYDMDLCKKSEEKQDAMEVKSDSVNPNPKETEDNCVVPVTPDTVRENDIQSPLTLTLSVVRKQLNETYIDSPRTPKDVVFDPFTPAGPDDDNKARAPHNNKCLSDFTNTVARRLNFDHPPPEPVLSDEDIFVFMNHTLLQFIISKQTEDHANSGDDDCKTPPSPLRLTGIADTCLAASLKVKPPGNPRIIQLGLCKELQF